MRRQLLSQGERKKMYFNEMIGILANQPPLRAVDFSG